MKIEIDLDRVRLDMQFRKAAMESDSTTVAIRQWGEVLTCPVEISDEFLLEEMRRTIERRISMFMQYAPDVSDLKPSEMRVELDTFGRHKRVFGSFFYCSQIADFWEKRKTDAVEQARRNARIDTLIELQERWLEESDWGQKRCWQRTAANTIKDILNRELGIDEDI